MTAAAKLPTDDDAEAVHPSAWLIAPTLALLSGQAIAAGQWTLPPSALAGFVLPLGCIFLSRWRRLSLLVLFSSMMFALGYERHRELLFPQFSPNHLRSLIGRNERLYLEGALRYEPEKLTNRTRFQVRSERIWHPTGAQEIDGDILLTVRAVRREWRYGDRVRFWIQPSIPRDSGNPGGFDYATYLAQRGIYVIGFLEDDREVELVARSLGSPRDVVESLRREIRRFIDSSLAPDSGALMKALVVGDMGGITREMRAAYTDAGVNHVLSISGLHVAMLGLVVFALIRFCAGFSSYLLLRVNILKVATFVSFLAVIFYTALAGAMVPTVRSAIMIGVYELAVLMDREEEVFASLTLAALLIGLVWPAVIADISFQLSFFAVLFIVWGMRKISDWFPKNKNDQLRQEKSWLLAKLRQVGLHLAVPLFATLGTGPLIAHYFGHLSLAGFIANPIIVPLVGFVVVPVGLSIGFLSLVAPDLGNWLVGAAASLTALTSWLVNLLARLPLANFSVPSPSLVEVIFFYLLLIGFFAARKKNHLVVVFVATFLAIGGTGAYWWTERRQRKELRVTHLNVGQGDAAVIELPGSKVVLLDAGGTATGDFDTGEAIIAPFLRSRKIQHIDYLVLTHARIDHYGGMRTIVREFSPQEFWSSSAKGQTSRFAELEENLAIAAITQVTLNGRDICRMIDDVRLCILYPLSDKAAEAPMVIRLEFGKLHYLFSSDIDRSDESILLQGRDDLESTVLTIPRHGSATSSTPEFIAAVKPKLAIVSAAVRSRNEANREEVLQRYQHAGVEVMRTYDDGAVIIRTDGKRLRYTGFKSGKQGEILL